MQNYQALADNKVHQAMRGGIHPDIVKAFSTVGRTEYGKIARMMREYNVTVYMAIAAIEANSK